MMAGRPPRRKSSRSKVQKFIMREQTIKELGLAEQKTA
jgi:hypothetical protein